MTKEARRKTSRKRLISHRTTPLTTPAVSPGGTESGANTRSAAAEGEDMNSWNWESVLCSDPEAILRQASRNSETDDESPLAQQHRLLDEKKLRESLKNPTRVMKEIMRKIEDREKERQQMSWQQQLHHLTKGHKSHRNKEQQPVWDLTPNPLTLAMEEVIQLRQKRISIDIDIPITPEPSDDDDEEEDSESETEEEETIVVVKTKKDVKRSLSFGDEDLTSSKKLKLCIDVDEKQEEEEVEKWFNDPGAGPSKAVVSPSNMSDTASDAVFASSTNDSKPKSSPNFFGFLPSKPSQLKSKANSKEKWFVGGESSAAPLKKEESFLDSVNGLKKLMLVEKAKTTPDEKPKEETKTISWDLSDEEDEATGTNQAPNLSPRKTRGKVKQYSKDMNAAFDALLASPFKNPIFDPVSECSASSEDDEETDYQPKTGFASNISSGVVSRRNSPEPPAEELSLPINHLNDHYSSEDEDETEEMEVAVTAEDAVDAAQLPQAAGINSRRSTRGSHTSNGSGDSGKEQLSMDAVSDELFEEIINDKEQQPAKRAARATSEQSVGRRSRKTSAEVETEEEEEVVFNKRKVKRNRKPSERANVPETVEEETEEEYSQGEETEMEEDSVPASPVKTRATRKKVKARRPSKTPKKSIRKKNLDVVEQLQPNKVGKKRKASVTFEDENEENEVAPPSKRSNNGVVAKAEDKLFKKPAKKIATRSSRSTRSEVSTSLSYSGRRT